MEQDELKHALARLTALKANLPAFPQVDDKYAQEFDTVLRDLETATSVDLQRYTMPHGRYCDRAFLLVRIDSVLNLFRLVSERRTIGFDG